MVNNQSTPKAISYDAGKITVNIFTVVSIVGFFMGITYLTVNERQKLRDEFRSEIRLTLSELKTSFERSNSNVLSLIDKLNIAVEKERTDHSTKHQPQLDELKSRVQDLYENQIYILENMMTKSGYSLWCYELQAKNTGFACPDYETLKRFGLTGSDEKRFHRPKTKDLYGPSQP